MNSEEIRKNYSKLTSEVKKSLPNFSIEYTMPKSKVYEIPSDATCTARNVIMYFNLATGKLTFQPEGPCIEKPRYGTMVNTVHIDTKNDLLVFTYWDIIDIFPREVKDKKALKQKPAKLISTVFLTREKTVVGKQAIYDWGERKYTAGDMIVGRYTDLNNGRYYAYVKEGLDPRYSINVFEAFREYFKIGALGGNDYTTFNDSSELSAFLRYKEPEMRDTAKQNLINELVKKELKVTKPIENAVKKLTNSHYGYIKKVCVASKVNNEYSALRWFVNVNDKPYEISRLYINKKTHIFCRKNTKGEFLVLNNKLTGSAFDCDNVIVQNKNAFVGTKLEYFESIYNSVPKEKRSMVLYTLTVFPEFEKMYKSDLSFVCEDFLRLDYHNWRDHIEGAFYKINPKEKNLYKILGINKYQAKRYSENRENERIICDIKRILNSEDISSIDNNTFDTLFDVLSKDIEPNGERRYKDFHCGLVNALTETTQVYSLKVALNVISKLTEIEYQTIEVETNWYGRRYSHHESGIHLYCDYVRLVRSIDKASDFRPYFTDINDIKTMHDEMVVLSNSIRDRVKNEKFTNRSEFWKRWEYDENEIFQVIRPKKPEDLAREGIELHHCVRGYIQRVADGVTNIMFIRKKSELDTPFFTVEVGNSGSIEQVHGFGNRNADTEPGLEDFIKEWKKAKKLKATNFNKVR